MIISAPTDYREAAKRRLPRFLFDYIDGGAITEHTMKQNIEELSTVYLRQRVLSGAGTPSLETKILDQKWAMPIALGPVGATGTYARRGEVQAARAASAAGIPYTLSTVSICPIEEVARGADGQLWSQLYVLKDHGYMRSALDRAWAAGMKTFGFHRRPAGGGFALWRDNLDRKRQSAAVVDCRAAWWSPWALLRSTVKILTSWRRIW